mmetsp:Transcript_17924/g.49723  ORF Transcript_17924/g.49723 Transcript_17924/m.49723 type:complete len:340 (+) Transcript_17924:236-1255(+)
MVDGRYRCQPSEVIGKAVPVPKYLNDGGAARQEWNRRQLCSVRRQQDIDVAECLHLFFERHVLEEYHGRSVRQVQLVLQHNRYVVRTEQRPAFLAIEDRDPRQSHSLAAAACVMEISLQAQRHQRAAPQVGHVVVARCFELEVLSGEDQQQVPILRDLLLLVVLRSFAQHGNIVVLQHLRHAPAESGVIHELVELRGTDEEDPSGIRKVAPHRPTSVDDLHLMWKVIHVVVIRQAAGSRLDLVGVVLSRRERRRLPRLAEIAMIDLQHGLLEMPPRKIADVEDMRHGCIANVAVARWQWVGRPLQHEGREFCDVATPSIRKLLAWAGDIVHGVPQVLLG